MERERDNAADHKADNEADHIADHIADNEADNEAERVLAQRLTEGEPEQTDPEAEAVRRLPPRWEIRIQTERDPVAEETAIYRTFAKEVDDRYDDKTKPENSGNVDASSR